MAATGVWLDSIFSPVRQTAFGTLGTTYTNATTSYTTVLSQTITLGRFSQASNTTQLSARADVAFTTATGVGASFALLINGTYYEAKASPPVSGGSGGGGEPTPPGQMGAAISSGGFLDEIIIAEAGDTARAVTTLFIVPTADITGNDTNTIEWAWYFRDSAGAIEATETFAPLDGTDLDVFARYDLTVNRTISAGGRVTLTGQSIGTGTAPTAFYGCLYPAPSGSAGTVGVGTASVNALVSLPLGSYTVSLVAKLLSADTLTINPSAGHRATLELVEYSAPTS